MPNSIYHKNNLFYLPFSNCATFSVKADGNLHYRQPA